MGDRAFYEDLNFERKEVDNKIEEQGRKVFAVRTSPKYLPSDQLCLLK